MLPPILVSMPRHDELPQWELDGCPSPHHAAFEREAELRREERRAEWIEDLRYKDKRRSRTSTPPPRSR